MSSSGAPVPWSYGLYGCKSDCKTFCISCWCPCITFGKITEIIDQGTAVKAAAHGTMYAICACFLCCQACYSAAYRTRMRNQFNLEGSKFNDVVIHCCCEPCALTQEYQELKGRGYNMETDKQKNKVEMAPVVEAGMQR